MIHQRVIKENPNSVKVMLDMKSSTTMKEVQNLTCYLAVVGRFISSSTDMYLCLTLSLRRKEEKGSSNGMRRLSQNLKEYFGNFLG